MSNTKDFKVRSGIQPTVYHEAVGTVVSGSVPDLSGSSFVDSFSVSSQATTPIDIHFKSDGTKMYILDNSNRFLYQYSLSTAWDVSTASYDNISLNTDTNAGIPYSFYVKPDGTILYINTSNGVFQYTMSTAWDLSTVSYANKTTARLSGNGMWISADGLTFYNCNINSGYVFQKSLATAWDISTATGTTTSVDLSSQESATTNVSFNSDGTKMYVTGINTDGLYQYSLSTAFDVTTATYDEKSFVVHDATENFVYGSFYDTAADRLYLLGMSNDSVYQYDATTTTAELDLSTGSVFEITPTSDVQVTLTNPAASGTSSGATLLLDGVATPGYDIINAFYTGNMLDVSTQETLARDTTFKPDGTTLYLVGDTGNDINQYSLSTAWDITSAVYVQRFSVLSQEDRPSDVFFKPDGTKMYIVGFGSDAVYQYTLSAAWDISTASYDSVSFSVASQTLFPKSLEIKSDGTKMYVLGDSAVYQYSLSTAWNLSTASYDSVSFSVATQDSDPWGLHFKHDGTYMYTVGPGNDTVYQYTLSTAWDISTVSYTGISFSVATQTTDPNGLYIKPDGTKMFITSVDPLDAVYEYSLTLPYTITYDTAIEWPSGTAPTSPAIGETDIITFNTTDGGTTYKSVQSIDGAK